MSRSIFLLLVFSLCVLSIKPLYACLWDYDTLAMEKARFPSALELITGKFARHSDSYYQWRVEDRMKKLEADPENLSLHDDLAVAYDKLGKHEDAIATIKQKIEKQPDEADRYESYANLGTFHIHNGQLEEGLEFIKKAIEINPDAHFGREIYQQKLVEYVLSKQDDGKLVLPMSTDSSSFPREESFASSFSDDPYSDEGKVELEKAVKGVLGMMRFGNHDSPVLLETLGHLLLAVGHENDAKRLAARAFLKASYEVEDESAKTAYREMAEKTLQMQTIHGGTEDTVKASMIEASLKKELDEAAAYFKSIEADEKAWIEAGEDVDEQFRKKYYEAEQKELAAAGKKSAGLGLTHYIGGTIAFLIGIGLLFVFSMKRKATPVA